MLYFPKIIRPKYETSFRLTPLSSFYNIFQIHAHSQQHTISSLMKILFKNLLCNVIHSHTYQPNASIQKHSDRSIGKYRIKKHT